MTWEPLVRSSMLSLAHARAREGDGDRDCALPIEEQVLDATPLEMRRWLKAVSKAEHRVRWRRLNQRRCSVLSSALRVIEAALGCRYAGRERLTKGQGWVSFGFDDAGAKVPVVEVALLPMHRFEDFRSPVTIAVLQPKMVDVDMLRVWKEKISATWGRAVAALPREAASGHGPRDH